MIKIGIPKEIKANEKRVSLIPEEVNKLINENSNIRVYIETNAGVGANFTDEDYLKANAIICDTAEEVYSNATIIIKVKEPQEIEYKFINETHTIFTFFHFASNPQLVEAMNKSKAKCIAYETIQTKEGVYPILAPMSKIAGEQAIIEADKFINNYYENKNNENDKSEQVVTIIGVGNVGKASAYKAKEMGYKTIHLLDKDYDKIIGMKKEGFEVHEMRILTLIDLMKVSTIIVGGVYKNGEKASRMVINDMLKLMPEPSIFMDVAIDQGGMTEQSTPTTIDNPIIKYNKTNIYCVPNIPSNVPREASEKLSKAIYPYLIEEIKKE